MNTNQHQIPWDNAPNPELDQVIVLGHVYDAIYKAFGLYPDSEERDIDNAEEQRMKWGWHNET